jgi:hypothetical protein
VLYHSGSSHRWCLDMIYQHALWNVPENAVSCVRNYEYLTRERECNKRVVPETVYQWAPLTMPSWKYSVLIEGQGWPWCMLECACNNDKLYVLTDNSSVPVK